MVVSEERIESWNPAVVLRLAPVLSQKAQILGENLRRFLDWKRE